MNRPLSTRVRRLAVLLGCVLSLFPLLAHAESGHQLTVVLRDRVGNGIAGVRVIVRDAITTDDLATALTDARGVAIVPALDTSIVRVIVAGSLGDGTMLMQRGLDSQGIWLRLDGLHVQLDLRVEPGGAVIPDPVTMIAAENGPLVTQGLPTRRPVLPVAAPTWPAPTTSRSTPASSTWADAREVVLGAVLLGVAGAIWLVYAWRRA